MSGKPNKKMFETMVKKHGSEEAANDWFRAIGSIGGKNGHTGGFYNNSDLARYAGARGGTISRRYRKDGTRNNLTPEQRAKALRKLERDQRYRELLAIHETARAERTALAEANRSDMFLHAKYLPVPGSKAAELAKES